MESWTTTKILLTIPLSYCHLSSTCSTCSACSGETRWNMVIGPTYVPSAFLPTAVVLSSTNPFAVPHETYYTCTSQRPTVLRPWPMARLWLLAQVARDSSATVCPVSIHVPPVELGLQISKRKPRADNKGNISPSPLNSDSNSSLTQIHLHST